MKECCDINMVVNDFYQAIYAYAMKYLGDSHLAEDVVQEVMYRTVQAHEQQRSIGHIRAWIYQTTRFVMADYYRNKGKLALSFSDDLPIELPALHESQNLDLMNDGMRAIIQILPEKYAQPLLWSDIEGIAQKEIANRLQLSLSATKMRIQRARQKLHALFVDCCQITYDKNGAFVSCEVKTSCTPLRQIEANLKQEKIA